MRRDVSAFTQIELIVVLVIVGVLASMLLPALVKVKAKAGRIDCVNNIKEIGTAYRLWIGDAHGIDNPATESVARGGWKDLLNNADQGPNCWTNYAIMANELGLNPKLLVCPSDERRPAKDFKTDFRDNTHLSYFVGVSANEVYPQSIQSGDRNLGPGTVPDSDYGYSPTNGKGNDVAVPISGPVSWSLKMHSAGNTAGAGNILLGDGSGQQTSSAGFRTNWLIHADPTTNWPAGHIPSSPSIRLVFP
jgi:type II secretory pathway pseudopilin PulG